MSDQHLRLREARIRAGYDSSAAAARAMGIGEAGYAHHENGTRKYRYETAVVYAKKFKTTPEWLMAGKVADEPDPGPREMREVVKLSWVGAGRLGPVAPIESADALGMMMMEGLPPGEWVAIEVEGDSMDRIAQDGSIIIVNRRDRKPVNRRFYVFVANDGETTFKRFRDTPDRYVPFSTNAEEEPIYPDLEPDREWRCFGRVHRVITDL